MRNIQKIIDYFNQEKLQENYDQLHESMLNKKAWLDYSQNFEVILDEALFLKNYMGANTWFPKGKVNYLKTIHNIYKHDNKEQIIIYNADKRVSYSNEEFILKVLGIIKKIEKQGFKKNDKVLFFMKDKELSMLYSFACLSLGISYGFLYEGFTRNYLEEIIGIVNPDHIVYDHDCPDYFAKDKLVQATLDTEDQIGIQDMNDYWIPTDFSPIIFLTSGTTAIPKVVLTGTFGMMLSGSLNTQVMFTPKGQKDYTLYNNLNNAWGASTILGYYGTLFSGNRLVLDNDMRSMQNGEINKKIETDGIDAIISVAVFFNDIPEGTKINSKVIAFTGEKLNFDSISKINKVIDNKKTTVLNLYGQIEFSGPIAFTYPTTVITNENYFKFTTFPGVEAYIDGDNDLILKNSYPSICQGISNSVEIYKSYWNENNDYKTKDLANLRSERDFDLLGRNDGLIKKKGRYLDLSHMENQIGEHLKILGKTYITSETCEYALFYESKENKDEMINKLIIDRFGKYALPEKLIRVDAFPRNYNGKIDMQILKGSL